MKIRVILIILLVAIAGVIGVFITVSTTVVIIKTFCLYISFLISLSILYRKQILFFNKKELLFLFFIYGFAILIYSLFVASSYEDYRYIFTVFVPTLVLPVIAFLSGNLVFSIYFFRILFYIGLPLSSLLYFSELTGTGDFTHYISFIYVFILFIPFVGKKIKVIIIAASLFSFFYDFDIRSNIINIIFCFLFLSCHYLRFSVFKFQLIRKLLLSIPVIILTIGLFGFSIFNFAENFDDSNSQVMETTDTRTFLYVEVFTKLYDTNALFYGISAAGRYTTTLADVSDDFYDELKNGRLGCEVGFLEYLSRGGILYVSLLFSLFFYASNLAISSSNNNLCRLLGLFIAFMWFFLFIEFQPSLNLANISVFVVIGICLTPKFRKLNNRQMQYYLANIFRV